MLDVAAEAPETPAGVLAALRSAHDTANAAEAMKLALTVDWAVMHPAESIDHAAGWPVPGGVPGGERARSLAGPGTPAVAEFCLADLAATLAMTTDAARSYLGAALELAHRLPRLYARVMAGDLPAWRARRVAERTTGLPVAGAVWVDRHLGPYAHRIGLPAIERAVEDALARFDPDAAETAAQVAADGRRFDVDLHALALTGTVEVHGCVDLADGLDLETALRAGAATQRALGSELSLDQRRARAAGDLARTQIALDLDTPDAPDTPEPRPTGQPTRKVVLHVHLSRAAIGSGNEPATLVHPGTGEVLVFSEQVRTWCNDAASVTVVPVVDLDVEIPAEGYDIPAHLDRQVRLRDRHCVFPWCTRPAIGCDLDHVVAHADGGPTSSSNLAPLCRFHHRLKTHGRWTYRVVDVGHYRWRDPHGTTYDVDTRPHGGTTPGPDPP